MLQHYTVLFKKRFIYVFLIFFCSANSVFGQAPSVTSVTPNHTTISDSETGNESFTLTIVYDEDMDQTVKPTVAFPVEDPSGTLTYDEPNSTWSNATTFVATFDVTDANEEVANIDVRITGAQDLGGDPQNQADEANNFSIDNKSATVNSITPSVNYISNAVAGNDAFTLTIVYNEDMDQTVKPTVTLPNEDPSATVTLDLAASNWTNATTFVSVYDVTDANEEVLNIDVRVVGGQDLVGNTQTQADVVDNFNVDNNSATVNSVTPNLSTITDANTGNGNFTITIVYSENMDQTTTPTVGFPTEDPSGSITFASGAWSNATTYVATYDVTDGNEIVTDVDVRITAAKDLGGNTHTQKDQVNNFTIHNQNGSVTSVTPNHSTISDAQNGGDNFTLTIVYNKDMDQTVNPTIAFPTEDPSGTLTFSSGAWTNATTYVGTYTVADGGEELADIDVRVTGGQDLLGNTQNQADEANNFSIDNKNASVTSVTPNHSTISDAQNGGDNFTLTVVYDENMDQTVNPTLAFPTEDPSGTLTFSSGAWSNATTYVGTYTVADGGEELADIDVRVTGGQDVIGNTQAQADEANNFSIDNKNASVTSVTPNHSTITDTQNGGDNFTLTVVYDENMDQTVNPTIAFPSEDPSGTLTFSSGAWSNATTYVGTYTVADGGEELANIDVRVTGGQDVIGNTQVQADEADNFNIDNKNASVTSVTPNHSTITDAQNGGDNFTLTVVYDENMDQTVDPTIAFPTEDPSGTLTFSSGAWTNATTYVGTYTVADGGEELADIDVRVTGGQDVIGNTQAQADEANNFSIDNKNASVTSVTPNHSTISDAQNGGDNFTLTVVYDENMDQTVDPTIAFPTEDPSGTLTFSSGAWTNATTYVGTYTVADGGEELADIDVRVTGGQDVIGNTQAQADEANNFSIDNKNPSVTSVTPNHSTITDAQNGGDNFTLTVVYDENMDQTVNPTIAFPTENPSGTLTFSSGAWSNATTYVGTYTVADGGEELANIDVRVTGGQDVIGNTQVQADEADNFNIDNKNPSVTSVTPNHSTITDAQNGGDNFTLTIVYDENMDQIVDPTIAFPTEDPSGTLTFSSGAWTNATTYVGTYTVADGGEVLSDIDVRVTGGQDVIGNTQAQADEADNFSIDNKNASVTSITPNHSTVSDAQNGGDNFTLTLVYDEDMDQTVDPTIAFPTEDPSGTLTFSSGAWSDATTYVATYTVADGEEEVADIDVRVTGGQDLTGNTQDQADEANNFSIDNRNPVYTSLDDGGGDNSYNSGETITFDLNLGEAGLTVIADFSVLNSGFSTTQALNDDGDNTYSFTTANLDDSGTMVEGIDIAITFTATDAAGNETQNNTLLVTLDKTLPLLNSTSLESENIYIDITFSEGVYANAGGTNPLETSDLNLTFTRNSGTAGVFEISSIKKNDNSDEGSASALTGGETTIRVFLDKIGSPNGDEDIEITPSSGSAIYDLSGNALDAGATTGVIDLNADTQPPTLEDPSVSDIADTSFKLSVQSNEEGVIYYVIVDSNSPAPTFDEVKAGTDANGNALGDNFKGNIPLLADLGITRTVIGMVAGTSYTVYITGEDYIPNIQTTVKSVNITTTGTDETAPTFTNNSPFASALALDGFTINVETNESGTVFYFIKDDGDTAPTAAEVIAENNTITVTALTNATEVITGKNAHAEFDIYLVARDASGNSQTSPSLLEVTTKGVVVSNPTELELCQGSPGAFSTLGDITISESVKDDFGSNNGQTLRLYLPSDLQFNTAVGAVEKIQGSDISNLAITVNSTNILITYDVDAVTGPILDAFKITSLQIQNVSDSTGGNLLRVSTNLGGGDADLAGILTDGGDVFAYFDSYAIEDTPVISGNDATCQESTETYSVPLLSGSSYAWTVTGGTIKSGAGTNEIEVTWAAVTNSAVNPHISLVETDENGCTLGTSVFPSTYPADTVLFYEYPTAEFTVSNSSPTPNNQDTPVVFDPEVSGGTFSGNGVIDTLFYPDIADIGTHEIYYTVTVNGCTTVSDTIELVVFDPSSSIQNLGTEYCEDDENATAALAPDTGLAAPEEDIEGVTKDNGDGTYTHTFRQIDYLFQGDGISPTFTGKPTTGDPEGSFTFTPSNSGGDGLKSIDFSYRRRFQDITNSSSTLPADPSETDVNWEDWEYIEGATQVVTIYDIPTAPTLSKTEYSYCIDTPLGDMATIETNNSSGSTYYWYRDISEVNDTTNSFYKGASITPTELADEGLSNINVFDNTTNDDYVYYVTELQNLNCQSSPTTVTITVFPKPTTPEVVDNDEDDNASAGTNIYEYCFSDNLEVNSLEIKDADNTYTYHWTNPQNGDEVIEEGTSISNNILADAIGGTWESDSEYQFGVFRSINKDDGGNVCPSDTLFVTIRIHAIPREVDSFDEDGSLVNDFFFCYTEAIDTLIAARDDNDDASARARFTWYNSSNAVIKRDTLSIGADTSYLTPAEIDAHIPKDSSDEYEPGTYSFNVTQTDTLTCESTSTTINITVRPVPDAPTIVDNNGTANDNVFNYCEEDDIADVEVQSSDPEFQSFTWYDSDGLEIAGAGSTISASQLGLADNPPGTYTYTVRQTSYDQECEGNPATLTIIIHPEPGEPTVKENSENNQGTNFIDDGIFEYCFDDEIQNIVVEGDAGGTVTKQFLWYNSDLSEMISTSDDKGDTITVAELSVVEENLGDKVPGTYTFYVTQTLFEIDNGDANPRCEGELKEVTIVIYDQPGVPTIEETNTGAFNNNVAQDGIFEYCFNDTMQDIVVSGSTDGDVVEQFLWYDKNNSLIATADTEGDVITAAELAGAESGLDNDGSLEPGTYTFYVSQTLYDIIPNDGTPRCEGVKQEITIVVHSQPSEPVVSESNISVNSNTSNDGIFEYCFNDVVETISVTGESGGTLDEQFLWYDSDGFLISTASDDGSQITSTELSLNGELTAGTYTYTVTQTLYDTELDDGFSRCEGVAKTVTVIIHPEPIAPTVDEDNVSINGNGSDDGIFEYCFNDAIADINVTGIVGSNVSDQFKWYKSDVDGNMTTTEINTLAEEDSGKVIKAAALEIAEPDLADKVPGTYTFYVTQTEFIIDPDDGSPRCEGVAQRVDIIIHPQPSMPTVVEENTGEFNSNDEDDGIFEYCYNDNVQEIVVEGLSDGSVERQFLWYKSDGTTLIDVSDVEGDTITAAELAVAETGLTNGSLVPGEYKFYVSQTEFEIDPTDGTPRCEGEKKEITIQIHEQPSVPTIQESNISDNSNTSNDGIFEYCFNDEVQTINVTGTDGTTVDKQFYWYDSSNSLISTASSDGSSITSTELGLNGTLTPGTYTYTVTQTLYETEESDGFDRCEGVAKTVTIIIHPEPVKPTVVETNISANDNVENDGKFEYCFDDDIQDINVEGISGSNVSDQFKWYKSDNDGNITSTEINTLAEEDSGKVIKAAALEIAEPNLANKVPGTYTFYVTQTEFIIDPDDGTPRCEGDAKKVDIIIHPQPGRPTITENNVGVIDGNTSDDGIFEFCFNDNIVDINVQGFNDGNVTEQFLWYQSDQTTLIPTASETGATITTAELAGAEPGLTNDGTLEAGTYLFYVSQTKFVIDPDDGTPRCEGEKKEVKIVVHPEPAMPVIEDNNQTAGDYAFEYCYNDNIQSIKIDNQSSENINGATYTWYRLLDDGSLDTLKDGQEIFAAEMKILNSHQDITEDTTYTLLVSQTEFEVSPNATPRCEGLKRTITITIHPEPVVPTVVESNVGDSHDLINVENDGVFEYCFGETVQTINVTGIDNAVFTWYRNDGTIISTASSDGSQITASELQVDTEDPRDYRFMVSQTEFFISPDDGSPGCEGEKFDVLVKVRPKPLRPRIIDNNVIPGDNSFEFCFDNNIDDIEIDVADTDNNIPGAKFRWYYIGTDGSAEPAFLHEGTVITEALLFNEVSFPSGTPDDGTYKFKVTQTEFEPNDIRCEGEDREFEIIIYPQPLIPVLKDLNQTSTDNIFEYCYNDRGWQISIDNPDDNTEYKWYDSEGKELEDIRNTIFDADLEIPVVNNSDTLQAGTYSFTVTQTLNKPNGNLCESEPTPFTIIIHPEPNVPVVLDNNGTPGDNVFNYCFEVNVEDIAIDLDNSIPGAYFTWYRADGINELVTSASDGSVITFSELKIDQNGDNIADLGSHTFFVSQTQYDISDPDLSSPLGCEGEKLQITVIIDELPDPDFSGFNEAREYCIDAEPVLLTGSGALIENESGVFSGPGIVDNLNNTATFFPNIAGVEGSAVKTSHRIVYTITNDITGCVDSVDYNLSVVQLPDNDFIIDIDGLKNEFCILMEGEAYQIPLVSGQDGEDNFSWTFHLLNSNGDTLHDAVVNNNAIIPSEAGIGTFTVAYSVTDFNTTQNCVNTLTKDITIHASPETEFTFTNLCTTDNAVQFTDLTTLDTSIGDALNEWEWDFGDGNGSSDQNPIYKFSSTGAHTIELKVTTAPFSNGNGSETSTCQRTITKEIFIESIPVPDFQFLNGCIQSDIEFVDDEGNDGGSLVPNLHGSIVERVWNFGDGTIISGSNEKIISHQYTTTGTFNVSLTTINGQGCDSTITKRIAIFPNVVVTPENFYFQDFEELPGNVENDHGWISDGVNNSWEIGTPIGGTYSGDSSWVTNLDGNYLPEEQSFVESPCFNLSNLQRPMFSFKYRMNTESGRDGAILQYTLDNGDTWNNVGDFDENETETLNNWYNSDGLLGDPGQQGLNAVGWSGTSSGWTTASHYLDFLQGQSSVRFRIAFGSDLAGDDLGFAFDDVFIGERTKNVLFEAFSNNRTSANEQSNKRFQEVIDNTDLDEDFILLKYYINFGGDNKLYQDNKNDPSARALYYGVLEADRVAVDGLNIESSLAPEDYNIEEEALETPWFNIDVVEQTPTGNGEIDFEVTLTATDSNTINQEILIHMAILENTITDPSTFGENDEVEFTEVLKDMVPNAAGTSISRQWAPGETEVRTLTWDNIFNVYNENDLSIIVFVQNNVTKEVYQSVKLVPNNIPQEITSLSKELPSDLRYAKLYPNPAASAVNLSFTKILEKNSDWIIYNQFGQQVNRGQILKGKKGITLDISRYPSGIYYVEVSRNNSVGFRKKFLIKH